MPDPMAFLTIRPVYHRRPRSQAAVSRWSGRNLSPRRAARAAREVQWHRLRMRRLLEMRKSLLDLERTDPTELPFGTFPRSAQSNERVTTELVRETSRSEEHTSELQSLM